MVKRFDANEWFILISLVISVGVALRLPRRFPATFVWMIATFSMTVAIVTDHIVGTPPLDMYDINDTPTYTVADAFTWLLYAPFGYLFLYVYDRLHIRGVSLIVYILTSVLFAVLYEYAADLAGVFHYRTWKLAYSFPVYVLTLSVFIGCFEAMKRSWLNMTKRRDGQSGALK